MKMLSNNSTGKKLGDRRDFWNLGINPITGVAPTAGKVNYNKIIAPDLQADYGLNSNII